MRRHTGYSWTYAERGPELRPSSILFSGLFCLRRVCWIEFPAPIVGVGRKNLFSGQEHDYNHRMPEVNDWLIGTADGALDGWFIFLAIVNRLAQSIRDERIEGFLVHRAEGISQGIKAYDKFVRAAYFSRDDAAQNSRHTVVDSKDFAPGEFGRSVIVPVDVEFFQKIPLQLSLWFLH